MEEKIKAQGVVGDDKLLLIRLSWIIPVHDRSRLIFIWHMFKFFNF